MFKCLNVLETTMLLIDYVPKGVTRQRMPLSNAEFFITKFGTYTTLQAAVNSLPNTALFKARIHENFFLLSLNCEYRNNKEGYCYAAEILPCRLRNCPLLGANRYD